MLGTLSTADFIRENWQEVPLFVRNALPDVVGLIDGDELAGIACEGDADARIITVHDDEYRCEHGPFEESRFADLPDSNWTLLVQSVDQWVPAVATLLDRFEFLPRWRLDDIMISVSADGGGVGPHFDYYDVFLIQASGTRDWRIGQHCDEQTPLRNNPDLRLLQEFELLAEHQLRAGDLLYLPAGYAHWGIAHGDNCITISVGFRAPSHRDLMLGAADQLADGLAENRRYRDSEKAIDADPYLINAHAIDQLLGAWPEPAGIEIRSALMHALGMQSTEPRNPEHIDAEKQWPAATAEKWLAGGGQLRIEHHRASRCAWQRENIDEESTAQLFVDGQRYATTAEFARGLCHGRLAAAHLKDPREREILLNLLNAGSIDINPES